MQLPFRVATLHSLVPHKPHVSQRQKNTQQTLSCPPGKWVNANIPYDTYEGVKKTMKLPTTADLAAAILTASDTAHLYCIDLSRAYRQFRVDPQDWPLLGLKWRNKYYFDRALAFGGRWHAATCQWVTGALRFIVAKKGLAVWPYLDDVVGLAPDLQTAHQHFDILRSTMLSLGLAEAVTKAIPPTRQLTWVGVHFNLTEMTMSIPLEKLTGTCKAVQYWLTQTFITVRQL